MLETKLPIWIRANPVPDLSVQMVFCWSWMLPSELHQTMLCANQT